jgi:D-3-phosphoglycerate dehydrogenase
LQLIHAAGVDRLRQAGVEPVLAPEEGATTILGLMHDIAAVITRNAGLSAAAIAAAPPLKVISVHGIGTEPVAVDAASCRGIPVIDTPYANVQSVAEHAIALTMALAESTLASDAAVGLGDDDFKYRARLRELHGASFGVLGFGNIGQATARLAAALGIRVRTFSNRQPHSFDAALQVEWARDLDELLAVSDVISLHRAPLPAAARPRSPPDQHPRWPRKRDAPSAVQCGPLPRGSVDFHAARSGTNPTRPTVSMAVRC